MPGNVSASLAMADEIMRLLKNVVLFSRKLVGRAEFPPAVLARFELIGHVADALRHDLSPASRGEAAPAASATKDPERVRGAT